VNIYDGGTLSDDEPAELDIDMDGEESGESDSPVDDTDGLVDEMELLTSDERKKLQANIRPVKLVLVKVSTL